MLGAAFCGGPAHAADQSLFHGTGSATFTDQATHEAAYQRARADARADAYSVRTAHETATGQSCVVTAVTDAETVEPKAAPPGTIRTSYVDYVLTTSCTP